MGTCTHMTLPEFFKNKRVLVTGHTGFKGAWLSHILLQFGADVSGFSLPSETVPNLYTLLSLHTEVRNHMGDVRDLENVRSVMREHEPEIVFHLAAQALVRKSYDDPMFTVSTNVGGTANVLEATREVKCARAVVIVTSDKVYTNREDGRAYKEGDALGGGDPYSASKAAADIVAQSYATAFFNPRDFHRTHETLVGIGRAGNVIGGGDWANDRLIPDVVRAVYQGDKVVKVRSPKSVRPWQHVLEPVYGYLLLARHLYEGNVNAARAWNFGPDASGFLSVEDIVQRSGSILGNCAYEVISDNNKSEARLLALDATEANQVLEWRPQLTADGALRRTLAWYKEYYFRGSITEITNQQIMEFFA